MIQVYGRFTSDFTRNGRPLQDTSSCYITEELNGIYELTLEHPRDDRGKWEELVEGNIIKADGQLFRIYHKQRVLDKIKVSARHIFYDLLDNFIEDARPEGKTGIEALDWILARTQFPHNFSCVGTAGGNATKYYIRKNAVEVILGKGGIIDTWGGEIERDNFVIKYNSERGLDRGVLIKHGKNILGIEETVNLDGLKTRILPLGKDGLMLPEKYIDSPYINNYPSPKIAVVEFTGCTEESELRTLGEEFFAGSKVDIPQFNYKIDFIELSKTKEYENYQVLERVYLGDTVTVRHGVLKIDLKGRIIKLKKNVLSNRIEDLELGNFKPNFATTYSDIKKQIDEVDDSRKDDVNALQDAIDEATRKLTSALGGYALKRENEFLVMDTPDPMTAVKVWRWNLNGLGYSSTGINGPYGTAITMDGQIVGTYIATHTLSVDKLVPNIGTDIDISQNASYISMGKTIGIHAGKFETIEGVTQKIETHFDFLPEGLVIGKDFSDSKLQLSNTQIDFFNGGKSVASISGQVMKIDNIDVEKTLTTGVHMFERHNSEITLIRWVGDTN